MYQEGNYEGKYRENNFTMSSETNCKLVQNSKNTIKSQNKNIFKCNLKECIFCLMVEIKTDQMYME